MVEANHRNTF